VDLYCLMKQLIAFDLNSRVNCNIPKCVVLRYCQRICTGLKEFVLVLNKLYSFQRCAGWQVPKSLMLNFIAMSFLCKGLSKITHHEFLSTKILWISFHFSVTLTVHPLPTFSQNDDKQKFVLCCTQRHPAAFVRRSRTNRSRRRNKIKSFYP